MTPRARLRLVLALGALAAVFALLAVVPGALEGLAMLAPAFALLVPLIAGRYPGEQALERLRGGRAIRPARRVAAMPPAIRPRPARTLVRLGTLLGAHLAVRPPPALG